MTASTCTEMIACVQKAIHIPFLKFNHPDFRNSNLEEHGRVDHRNTCHNWMEARVVRRSWLAPRHGGVEHVLLVLHGDVLRARDRRWLHVWE